MGLRFRQQSTPAWRRGRRHRLHRKRGGARGLSGLLSEREEEIEQLKLTVERECLERGNLIAEHSRARQGRKNM